MIVRFSVATGYVGSRVTEDVELPDDYTEEQITHEYLLWLGENTDQNWYKLHEDSKGKS